VYKKAGVEYPGALEDVCNLKGVPSVTCEVLSPHGSVAQGSVGRSFTQMVLFLQYNNYTGYYFVSSTGSQIP